MQEVCIKYLHPHESCVHQKLGTARNQSTNNIGPRNGGSIPVGSWKTRLTLVHILHESRMARVPFVNHTVLFDRKTDHEFQRFIIQSMFFCITILLHIANNDKPKNK